MDTIHKIHLQLAGPHESGIGLDGTLTDHFTVKFDEFPEVACTFRRKIMILLGSAGQARYRINGRTINMSEGTLLIVLPEDDLVYERQGQSYQQYRISFSVSFLHGVPVELPLLIHVLKELRANPGLHLNSITFSHIEKQLLSFHHNNNAVHPFYAEMLQRVFSIFLLELAGSLEVRQNKRDYLNDMLSRKQHYCGCFLDLVAKHYNTERFVAFYADKMCLTPKYISSLVKEVSGKTASEWIDEFVLSEARKLLESSMLSVQQIAYTLNFPNPSFFGRYFKNHTGISPLQYRIGIIHNEF